MTRTALHYAAGQMVKLASLPIDHLVWQPPDDLPWLPVAEHLLVVELRTQLASGMVRAFRRPASKDVILLPVDLLVMDGGRWPAYMVEF